MALSKVSNKYLEEQKVAAMRPPVFIYSNKCCGYFSREISKLTLSNIFPNFFTKIDRITIHLCDECITIPTLLTQGKKEDVPVFDTSSYVG